MHDIVGNHVAVPAPFVSCFETRIHAIDVVMVNGIVAPRSSVCRPSSARHSVVVNAIMKDPDVVSPSRRVYSVPVIQAHFVILDQPSWGTYLDRSALKRSAVLLDNQSLDGNP